MTLVAGLLGCVRSATVTCEDGRICPSGSECATLTTTLGTERDVCVNADERSACDGKLEGESCDLEGAPAGGGCHDGICVLAICGNGLLDPDEICDDENTSNDDDCSSDCRSTLVCGNAWLDLIRGEQCDAGDAISHDGCASTCQIERPSWLEVNGDRPAPRTQATLAFDATRRRTVVFGGARDGIYPLGDTSEWDGQRWHANASATTPSNRYAHVMAFDAERGELVVFSGVNNQSDTWVTVDGVWQLRVTAHAPPTRDYAGMVYDSARKRVVLFGGFSPETQEALDDMWMWDGVDWQELTPATRPPPLLAFGMAYDPRRDVIVLFGGTGTVLAREDQVWEFDGVTWANRTPAQGPSARTFTRLAYDPDSEEVLMTGGDDGTSVTNEAYTWDGTRWQAQAPVPTTDSLVAHAMSTDPVLGGVLVLAGDGTLYQWRAGAWTVPPGGTPSATPPPRERAAMVLDPVRSEIVMFGGADGAPGSLTPVDETWIWLSGWSQQAPATTPPARWSAAMAYDEARREIVMYGGCTAVDGLGDTWVWNADAPSPTWIQKSASSPPGKRCGAAMTFDAKRGNLVLVAGHDGYGTQSFATTTWTWDGATWTQAPTTTSPPPMLAPALVYDRVSERVLLFGGARATLGDSDETWTWDGTSWTELAPNTVPPARSEAGLAWDPARGRAVLAGGLSTEGNYTFADAYEWDGTNWIPTVGDYPARRAAAMTTAPDGAGVLMFGGDGVSPPTTPNARLGDTRRLRWDADVAYEACADSDADGDDLIGCLDPDCWWICSPTCPPRTTCATDAPRCGDLECNTSLETCYACPADCGACPTYCGDFACDPDETTSSCPGDCT